MKLFWRYGKTFAALLAAGAILLFGQAACDLALPSIMGEIAQSGWGQDSGTAAAPGAVSLQGMTLLQCFMDEESQRQMSEAYLTFEPGSSESQRLSEQYPGAREQAVCALREGLSEEQLAAAAERYEKSAYAFFLYLQQEREAGTIDDFTQAPANKEEEKKEEEEKDPGNFRDNLREDLGQESSLPEGVLGTMPEGALFKLPESSAPEEGDSEGNAAGMLDSEEQTFGNSKEDIAEREARANTRSIAVGDIDGMDIERLYTLLPRLARTQESVISALISAAEQGDRREIRQTGRAFQRLFYRELGVSAEELSEGGQNRALKLTGIALAGLISGLLAVLLLSRIVTLMSERLFYDLNQPEELSRTMKEIRRCLPLCLCTVCTVPVWLIGGTVLAAAQKVAVGWRIAIALFGAAGMVLPFVKALRKPFTVLAKKLLRSGKGLRRLFPLGVTAATWLMNLICAIVILAGGDTGQSGAGMAFAQYAVQTVLAVLTAGVTAAMLRRLRQNGKKLKSKEG